jgi:hypothetical protein
MIFLFSLLCNAQVSGKDTLLNGKKISFAEISENEYTTAPAASADHPCRFFDGCDSLEKVMIAKSGNNVWRDKWKLFLKCSDGNNVVLIDSLTNSDYKYILTDSAWSVAKGIENGDIIWSKYHYLNYFENTGYYFLIEYFYEGYAYLLINRKNGNRTQLEYMTRFPQFNAKKNAVIFCSDGWPYQSFSGYKMMSMYPDSTHIEWSLEYQPYGWLPNECKWINDHSFYAKEHIYPVQGDPEYNDGNWNDTDLKKRYFIVNF